MPAPALRTEAVAARKEARLEHRRLRLLRAALELFAERGYEETSVGAIVARARQALAARDEVHVQAADHQDRPGLLRHAPAPFPRCERRCYHSAAATRGDSGATAKQSNEAYRLQSRAAVVA